MSRRDTRTLAEFQEKAPDFLQQLKETGEPIVLTVDGKAAVVVQDALSYQKMRALIAEAETLEGIRQGLQDMRAGRTVPLEVAFSNIRRDLNLPADSDS